MTRALRALRRHFVHDRPGVPAVRAPRRFAGSRGQATVEVVASLPLCATVALAIGHVLAAGVAHELAGHAAEAGAIAAIRGADPAASVRASLPEWARDRVTVRVRGTEVRVRLRPPAVVAEVADLLASTATSHAGPAARSAPVTRTSRSARAPRHTPSRPSSARTFRSARRSRGSSSDAAPSTGTPRYTRTSRRSRSEPEARQ